MVINELAEQSAQMEVESAKQQEAQARKGKFRAALKVSGDFGKNLTEQYQQEEVKEAEKTVDDNER